MASEIQTKFIQDLAVQKTKEFKEVKEMLLASDIVGDNPETIKNAKSLPEILNAMTDYQASQFIDLLIAAKKPVRQTSYATKRVEKVAQLLDDILNTIEEWDFQ